VSVLQRQTEKIDIELVSAKRALRSLSTGLGSAFLTCCFAESLLPDSGQKKKDCADCNINHPEEGQPIAWRNNEEEQAD